MKEKSASGTAIKGNMKFIKVWARGHDSQRKFRPERARVIACYIDQRIRHMASTGKYYPSQTKMAAGKQLSEKKNYSQKSFKIQIYEELQNNLIAIFETTSHRSQITMG